MRTVVIHDQKNIEIGRHIGIDGSQKLEEPLAAVTPMQFADHLAGGDIRERMAKACAVLQRRAQAFSCSRSSSFRTTCAFGRPPIASSRGSSDNLFDVRMAIGSTNFQFRTLGALCRLRAGVRCGRSSGCPSALNRNQNFWPPLRSYSVGSSPYL